MEGFPVPLRVLSRTKYLEELDLEAHWFEVYGVNRSPGVKAEYDHILAGNIGRAFSLNMETIMLGDMNFDYLQKELKKTSTGQRIEIF